MLKTIIQKLAQWITLRIQKLSFLLVVLVAVGYFNDISTFYANFIKQKRAEDGLQLMNAGVYVKHVESVFGPPILVDYHDKNDYYQYTYSVKNFYMQVVFNMKGTCIFYSVTVKNPKFKPLLPFVKMQLGETFKSYSDKSEFISVNMSSKVAQYQESFHLGNPGNYRHLVLAYNNLGASYHDFDFFDYEDVARPKKAEIEKFREQAYPNVFGVTASYLDGKEVEQIFGIGVDFFTSRDLPDLNY